jgi:outer membrane protein assembly factor BamB
MKSWRLWWPLLILLGGCSMMDSLNPFSTEKDKAKVPALAALEAKVPVQSLWQGKIGSAGSATLLPAVSGNSVYAAAADGSLARFDGDKPVWRIATEQPISGGVGTDGKLVIVGTSKGEVLAFDAATGKAAWKASVHSEVLAPPAIADGLVMVRSGDSSITSLDAADGKLRWVYQRSIPALVLRSYASPLMVNNLTIAGFPGGKLVAIANSNGAAVWEATVAIAQGSTELERMVDVAGPAVLDGNTACAVAFQGRAACFDTQKGRSLWTHEISSIVGLAMDERRVYVTDVKGNIQALDRESGTVVWNMNKLAGRSPTRPIVVDDWLVVADVQGLVHILRREDGAFAGRVKTDDSAIRAAPVRYADGFLVQTSAGGLFAMKPQTKQ